MKKYYGLDKKTMKKVFNEIKKYSLDKNENERTADFIIKERLQGISDYLGGEVKLIKGNKKVSFEYDDYKIFFIRKNNGNYKMELEIIDDNASVLFKKVDILIDYLESIEEILVEAVQDFFWTT